MAEELRRLVDIYILFLGIVVLLLRIDQRSVFVGVD